MVALGAGGRRGLAFLGWAVGSLGTVFLNEWILVTAHVFNYPLTLTLLHLVTTGVTGVVLTYLWPLEGGRGHVRTAGLPTSVGGGRGRGGKGWRERLGWVEYEWAVWVRGILPLGLAYWGNVVCNNLSFEDLEVDFLQVVKATGPAWVLLITFAMGTQKPTLPLMGIIVLISGGIILASLGELEFVWRGFVLALSATLLSAVRTALIESATLHHPLDGRQLFPSTALPAACLVFVVWLFVDFPILVNQDSRDDHAHRHPDYSGSQVVGILLGSCALAALSNFGRYAWIASSSSIVYSVTGVLKDVVIVVFSLLFLGESVTALKIIGILLAFSGVVWFTYLENTGQESTMHSSPPATDYAHLPKTDPLLFSINGSFSSDDDDDDDHDDHDHDDHDHDDHDHDSATGGGVFTDGVEEDGDADLTAELLDGLE